MSKMERNFLEDLGLEKEVVDKIMAENGKDIENAKANYDELKAELKTANATIADRDNQLKELKGSAKGNEDLTAKIAELEKQNKDEAKNHKAEIESLKINNAIDKALATFKAKTPKAVTAMLDMENIKFDEDGNITGIDEQLKTLLEAEDTKYLFSDDKPNFKGTQPGFSPDNNENFDTSKMTYSQMCAYLEKNPDAKI